MISGLDETKLRFCSEGGSHESKVVYVPGTPEKVSARLVKVLLPLQQSDGFPVRVRVHFAPRKYSSFVVLARRRPCELADLIRRRLE